MQIKWNWKRQRRHVVLSSMEIVLVVWGLSLVGSVVVSSYVVVFRVQGPLPPLNVGALSWLLIHLALALLALCLKKE